MGSPVEESAIALSQLTLNGDDEVGMNITTSIENIQQNPAWLDGEVLFSQKFFVHNTYLYAQYDITSNNKQTKSRKRSKRQKQKNLNVNDSSGDQDSSTDEKNGEINLEDSNLLPLPGSQACSLLNMLNYFSYGLSELFPHFVLNDKLKTHLSESDSIHVITKIYDVLSLLDTILENQVEGILSKEDIDINFLTCREDIINAIKDAYISKNSDKNMLNKKDTENIN